MLCSSPLTVLFCTTNRIDKPFRPLYTTSPQSLSLSLSQALHVQKSAPRCRTPTEAEAPSECLICPNQEFFRIPSGVLHDPFEQIVSCPRIDTYAMDFGELDLSSQLLLPNLEMNQSMDEFFRNGRTCTHTHTCNPPGPAAASHTHTCYHTHTQVFETREGEIDQGEETKKSGRSPGNREAVRKYREKKKAHEAYLEEEVKKLRLMNQQLMKKLQGQLALGAEVVRLRSLLSDVRGKIDAELGGLPFQTQCNAVSLHCDSNGQCISGSHWGGNSMPAIVDCQITQTEMSDKI